MLEAPSSTPEERIKRRANIKILLNERILAEANNLFTVKKTENKKMLMNTKATLIFASHIRSATATAIKKNIFLIPVTLKTFSSFIKKEGANSKRSSNTRYKLILSASIKLPFQKSPGTNR